MPVSVGYAWVRVATEACRVAHRDRYRPSFPLPLEPERLLRKADPLLVMEAVWEHVAEQPVGWGCYPCP